MQIEKDIPLPETKTSDRKSSGDRHRFSELAVGESVFLEGESTQGKTCMSARQAARRSGKVFVTRNVDGGVRIWRTE